MTAAKGKTKDLVASIALPGADIDALKALAKKRKQSVDAIASSIVRRFVRGRLV